MHSRYATRRKRVGWMSPLIGQGYRTWGPVSQRGSPDYSLIPLFPLMKPAYRAKLDRQALVDLEHYVRIATEIISSSCEVLSPKARDLVGGNPREIEAELVSRLKASAHQLGHALAELIVWVQNRPDRPRGAVTDRRGRERRKGDRPE